MNNEQANHITQSHKPLLFWEMHNVSTGSVAGPSRVINTTLDGTTHRVNTRQELSTRAQHVQGRLTHPSHDPHVRHHIGAVSDLSTNLGDGLCVRLCVCVYVCVCSI